MQQAHNDGVVSAMSQATDARQAAQELAAQLLHPHLGFVLFFCSAEYDLQALGEALEQGFGGIRLVGCTSAGKSPAGLWPQLHNGSGVRSSALFHSHRADRRNGALQPDRRPADGRAPGRHLSQQ